MKSIAMNNFDEMDMELARRQTFSIDNIRERLKDYGFTEIDDVVSFLNLFRESPPGDCEYIYIRNKLGLCLEHHDNETDYFIPLREFVTELDCLIAFR